MSTPTNPPVSPAAAPTYPPTFPPAAPPTHADVTYYPNNGEVGSLGAWYAFNAHFEHSKKDGKKASKKGKKEGDEGHDVAFLGGFSIGGGKRIGKHVLADVSSATLNGTHGGSHVIGSIAMALTAVGVMMAACVALWVYRRSIPADPADDTERENTYSSMVPPGWSGYSPEAAKRSPAFFAEFGVVNRLLRSVDRRSKIPEFLCGIQLCVYI